VLVMFLGGASPAADGVLQRIGVTLPLAALGAVALRLLATGRARDLAHRPGAPAPGVT